MSESRSFSIADNVKFARVSGDWNPLHVDPVLARRTLYGENVAHGMHVALWVLDAAMGVHDMTAQFTSFQADFLKPIRVGDHVQWELVEEDDPSTLRLSVHAAGKTVSTLHVQWVVIEEPGSTSVVLGQPTKNDCEEPALPELKDSSGMFGLNFDRAETKKLLPNLCRIFPDWQLASLLSLTDIVGMRAPGLNSIFLGCDIQFEGDSAPTREMAYRVTRAHKITGLVKIEVEQPALFGTMKAVYRPTPASQPTYAEVLNVIDDGLFQGHRALIVGGSRGLGETIAKMCAAGGASVVLTYANGREDAERIASEIRDGGGEANVARLDVTEMPSSTSWLPDLWNPTALFYFASPPIIVGETTEFVEELYDRYYRFYVSGLSDLIQHLHEAGQGPKSLFYPSSVFLDEAIPNAAEYIAAKEAGEALCEQLRKTYSQMEVCVPRLPRMLTDQTVSIMPLEYPDTVGAMLPILKDFFQ